MTRLKRPLYPLYQAPRRKRPSRKAMENLAFFALATALAMLIVIITRIFLTGGRL